MNANEFRKAAHAAIEEIISYNANIAKYPVLPQIKPGYLRPMLPTSAPKEPETWANIQPDIANKIIPGLTHWQSPKFMAFFPACATYPSMLGELYSAAFTAPAFNWLCSPACTELETVVMDWIAQAFDLPPSFLSNSSTGGGGVIQGSASETVVTCMVAARERYLRTKCDNEGLAHGSPERDARIAQLRGKLVALSSDQAHSSTHKGAIIAGTKYKSITTSLSNDLALKAAGLEQALKECADEGLEPYYITLTIGTTSTCTTDDFESLRPVLSAPTNKNIWVHVDAAYAGTALICPEYSSKLSHHMTMVDSFNTNMHKWMLVNFDASVLFVQRRSHLTQALSISAAYYENKHTDSGLVTDYRDWQIPLGRRFRALKIWFVMRTYGVSGMQEHIRKTVKLGDLCAQLVKERSDLFEIIGTPAFALTCFRINPKLLTNKTRGVSGLEVLRTMEGVTTPSRASKPVLHGTSTPIFDSAPPGTQSLKNDDVEALSNKLTKRVTDLINERGEIFITSSTTAGKSFIRVVSGNANAEEKYVRLAFDEIVKTTEEVVANLKNSITNSETNGTA